MTNGWVDIKNADVILCMGGNPAENHPCGFKWAIEARKLRNAKIVAVDPRFTRTAAVADFYSPIRAGTDIAYLNSMKTLAVFADHGIRNFSVVSSHGHEWLNWRRYLWQTAQIMFPEDR